MKLIRLFLVVLAAALIGGVAGYKAALAREHHRLQRNKELVRLAYQLMNEENNKETIAKMTHLFYADKFTVHDWLGDRTIGPGGMADEVSETLTDFSGWTEHPEILVAEGDYVAVRSWASGKQAKDFDAIPHNTPAIPNKGRSLAMQESIVFRIADGKLAEEWALNDGWDVNLQLGLFDPDHWRESVCGTEAKH